MFLYLRWIRKFHKEGIIENHRLGESGNSFSYRPLEEPISDLTIFLFPDNAVEWSKQKTELISFDH